MIPLMTIIAGKRWFMTHSRLAVLCFIHWRDFLRIWLFWTKFYLAIFRLPNRSYETDPCKRFFSGTHLLFAQSKQISNSFRFFLLFKSNEKNEIYFLNFIRVHVRCFVYSCINLYVNFLVNFWSWNRWIAANNDLFRERENICSDWKVCYLSQSVYGQLRTRKWPNSGGIQWESTFKTTCLFLNLLLGKFFEQSKWLLSSEM